MDTHYRHDAGRARQLVSKGATHKRRLVSPALCALAALLALAAMSAGAADAPAAAAPTPPPALARPPAPPPAPATRIILLGTAGGPGIIRERSEPASLLVVDGKPYLIDAGQGVSRQIVLAGFQLVQIHNIFITHHHADHNAGLPALISLQWFGRSLGQPQPPEQIYGPPSTRYLVGKAVDYVSATERIFKAGIPQMLTTDGMFEAHDIDHDGVVYKDDKVKVTAAENTHFSFKSSSPAGEDRSFSYRFDTKYGSVVFSGDTGPSKALEKLARGADVLVCEVRGTGPAPQGGAPAEMPVSKEPPNTAMGALMYHLQHEHLSPEEVGEIAQAAHVKVVVLTHIVPAGDSDIAQLTAGVKKTFRGIVIPGKDFLEYDLD